MGMKIRHQLSFPNFVWKDKEPGCSVISNWFLQKVLETNGDKMEETTILKP